MAGAGVVYLAVEHRQQHVVQVDSIGIFQRAIAAPFFEQEQGVAVERDDIEVVGMFRGQFGHLIPVEFVLYAAGFRVVVLDVADLNRPDHVGFLRTGVVDLLQRLARRRQRPRRFGGGHGAVEIRTPGPGFAPIADRAIGVRLPGGVEGTHGFHLGEAVHELESLVEIALRQFVFRGNGVVEIAHGLFEQGHGFVESGRIFDFLGDGGSLEHQP